MSTHTLDKDTEIVQTIFVNALGISDIPADKSIIEIIEESKAMVTLMVANSTTNRYE